MEMEKDNSLPFLDVLISRLPNDSLTHQLYWKKTDTDTYLHAQSHHHPAKKYVVLKTLVTQAIRISDPQVLEKEKSHLTKSLVSNGYISSQINKYFRSRYKSKSTPNSHLSSLHPRHY
jgi:hypothetical protein